MLLDAADVEGLVHDVLVRWGTVTPADMRDEETFDMLQERVEELFAEASVLEAVRQNTVIAKFLTACVPWMQDCTLLSPHAKQRLVDHDTPNMLY